MWNFCQSLALKTRSKDREWSRFDLAVTKLLQYIRGFVLVAVYFFDRIPLQKCMEDLFEFFNSLVFCQTREPPRFELKGDGAVFFCFQESFRLGPGAWLSMRMIFAPDPWTAENAKIGANN